MPYSWKEDLLILTKTYPNPSGKYGETTCVAALNGNSELRRLYPVPFRLLSGSQQFKKWEWVQGTLHKANDDHRPESHRLHVDTLQRTNRRIGTEGEWRERRAAIRRHLVDGFESLEKRRQATGETLGFIGPVELVDLSIKATKQKDWTEAELRKLRQESLFDSETVRERRELKKVPFEFRYRYRIATADGVEENVHMITDWEAGALYWNCVNSNGGRWERPFREKLVDEFSEKDLYFLMGTVHRFPDTWLIVGLYYPPRSDPGAPQQNVMF